MKYILRNFFEIFKRKKAITLKTSDFYFPDQSNQKIIALVQLACINDNIINF